MKIPVANIYYLLCYAWDKLDEGKRVDVSASDYEDALNLFSKVLVNGCRHLFKRGLEHTYQDVMEEYIGIKGKLDFKASLNKNLFEQGRSVCQFSRFDADNLQNQLLKATLSKLLRTEGIEKKLRTEIRDCYWRFGQVSDIEPDLWLFSQIRIHKNNSFYEFLLNICRLVLENIVLDERSGNYSFTDFVRSEEKMAKLFEAFIRNFYRREQDVFSVRREDIEWAATPLGDSTRHYLPQMQTDITLESPDRKIIIETKYYAEALASRFGVLKYKSGNLYQLNAYLQNIEHSASHRHNYNCEGTLLYPAVNYSLNEEYEILGHRVRVCTVDLGEGWRDVRERLLRFMF